MQRRLARCFRATHPAAIPLEAADLAATPSIPQSARRTRANAAWDARLHEALRLDIPGEGIPEASFLGPYAEDADLLRDLVLAALDSHVGLRSSFNPEDPAHITPAIQASPGYLAGAERLRRDAEVLFKAAPVCALRLHALPGAHALGHRAAGAGRADRGAAI